MSSEICELLFMPCDLLTAADAVRLAARDPHDLRAADAVRLAARDPWRPARPVCWPA
jgi:hypothetical protein